MNYMIRVRETGKRRHRLVARDRLTDKWVHAIGFETQADAHDYAVWLLDNNRGALDSAQVVDAFGDRRVVETFLPEEVLA